MNSDDRLYASLPFSRPFRTWAEIDLSALRENYRFLCEKIGRQAPLTRPIAVVKADAYGHGASACVRALSEEGCDFFAVSCLEEAIAIRQTCDVYGHPDILILGYTDPACAQGLSDYDLIQTLISEQHAEALSRTGVRLRVHVALDTGMNRIGFPAQSETEIAETVSAILRLKKHENLQIEGMFTHFARADEGSGGTPATDAQATRFRSVRSRLEQNGFSIPLCHICNSAGAICRPADAMDAVRLGIALYGVCPSDRVFAPLRPVMRLCTTVTHIHRVSAGAEVGYGGIWKAKEDRLIATLPIGYADGWLRAYSGATVSVHTANGVCHAPIVGKICMDQCMIDVTRSSARIGNTVTLFGQDPRELSLLAKRAGTIEYESLCLISARVPRVYSDR